MRTADEQLALLTTLVSGDGEIVIDDSNRLDLRGAFGGAADRHLDWFSTLDKGRRDRFIYVLFAVWDMDSAVAIVRQLIINPQRETISPAEAESAKCIAEARLNTIENLAQVLGDSRMQLAKQTKLIDALTTLRDFWGG